MGDADVVFECVGTNDNIDDALRFTNMGEKLVMVGLFWETKKVDWTPLWFKELKVFGTNTSAEEKFNGEKKRCYQIALELMEKRSYLLKPYFSTKGLQKSNRNEF